MVPVIDLIIRAHKPYARVIVISFSRVTVIPLTVKLYQKPIVDISVISRITVYSHVRNACLIEKHFAARIIYIAVAAALGESSVCGIFIVGSSGKKSEPQIVVNPVEDCSCSLNIVASDET